MRSSLDSGSQENVPWQRAGISVNARGKEARDNRSMVIGWTSLNMMNMGKYTQAKDGF